MSIVTFQWSLLHLQSICYYHRGAQASGLGSGFRNCEPSPEPYQARYQAQLSSGFWGSAARASGLWAEPCTSLAISIMGLTQHFSSERMAPILQDRGLTLNSSLCLVTTMVGTQYSARAGGATFFTSLGLSEDIIQAIGRWSSKAWKIYIQDNPSVRPSSS